MSPACWRTARQELDQLGVAGVEAARGRRPGSSAWTASARPPPRRSRAGGSNAAALPGELGVALVGEDRDAVCPSPRRLGPEVAQATRRVGRRVRPQDQRTAGVGGVDGAEVEPARSPRRRGHGIRRGTRPASAPMAYVGYDTAGYRTVSRSGSAAAGRGAPKPRAPWCRRRRPRRPSATSASPKRRTSHAGGGRRAAPRCRPRPGSPARCPTTRAPSTTSGGGGSHGVPTEQSTMPPGMRLGQLGQTAPSRS